MPTQACSAPSPCCRPTVAFNSALFSRFRGASVSPYQQALLLDTGPAGTFLPQGLVGDSGGQASVRGWNAEFVHKRAPFLCPKYPLLAQPSRRFYSGQRN